MVVSSTRLRGRAARVAGRLLALSSLAILTACAGSGSASGRLTLTAIDLPVAASLRGIAAPSADTVWVSGSGGTVARTIDGGESWDLVGPIGAQSLDFRSLWVFDSDTAIVASAGSPARVFRTENGGRDWELVHSDDRAAIFLDAMAFDDTGRGVLVGDPIDGRFVVLESDDHGRRWRRSPRAPAAERDEAAFAASNTAIALTREGLLLGTSHSARILRGDRQLAQWQWSRVPIASGTPARGVFSLAFATDGIGCAVGGDYTEAEERSQTAAFTLDGGRTWLPAERMPSGYRSAVLAATAFDPGVRLAAGPNGVDLSSDGGRHWYRLFDRGHHALAAARDGSAVVYAAGADGRVSRIRSN
ncbi:MAG: oxidoreductase [Planctomycetota bacterium]